MSEPVELFKTLVLRPIAYQPFLREVAGSSSGALLLSQLLYWLERSSDNHICKTDEQIQIETHLTVNELRGARLKLKSLPFLTITQRGFPRKTQYAVDWEGMVKYCQNHLTYKPPRISGFHGYSPVESTGLSTANNSNKVKDKTTPPTTPPKPSSHRVGIAHPRWGRFATRLHAIAFQTFHVDRSHQIPSWATHLEKLHRVDKVSVDRIRRVLEWYEKVGPKRPPYTPQAYAGRTFREKFGRLEAVMLRQPAESPDRPSHTATLWVGPVWLLSARIGARRIADSGKDVDTKALGHVLQTAHEWARRVRRSMREAVKLRLNGSDGITIGRDVQIGAVDLFTGFTEAYLRWIQVQAEEWTLWPKTLADFYPGQKHFKTFVRGLEKSAGWHFSTKERGILDEATNS